MDDLILADQIRTTAYEAFVGPALELGERATIRAGDLHKHMRFTDRVPLVCASLRARKFSEQFGLRLVGIEGRPVSTTTTFVFMRASNQPATAEHRPKGLAWAEITTLEHGHGGPGWDLGRWLWSPTTSKDGADRYGVMQLPEKGDQVFHLVAGTNPDDPRERVFFGVSEVLSPAEITTTKPSAPGSWGNAASYFRIALANFVRIKEKISMEIIENELKDFILLDLLSRPKYYPYAPYREGFRGAQGIYLTRLSGRLTSAFRELANGSRSTSISNIGSALNAMHEFVEGERDRREARFFRRNPALRAAAIAAHGVRCVACEIDFGEKYGPLGEGYIEIHHLNPLADRTEMLTGSTTKIDEVVPLCSNCHRMVHRRRPALTLLELRDALEAAAK